jgi:hypothetical protein
MPASSASTCRRRSSSRSSWRTARRRRGHRHGEVAKSAPDGYTLLMMSNTHTTNETLLPNRPYQLMRDFAPVAPVNASDLIM